MDRDSPWQVFNTPVIALKSLPHLAAESLNLCVKSIMNFPPLSDLSTKFRSPTEYCHPALEDVTIADPLGAPISAQEITIRRAHSHSFSAMSSKPRAQKLGL